MSFWLTRDGEEGSFDMSHRAWGTILDIAEVYGWEPHGTILEDFEDYGMEGWCGSYMFNQNQTVTFEDALNIASALSKGVEDDFQKLIGTDLKYVLEKKEGSTSFVRQVIAYVERGSFRLG